MRWSSSDSILKQSCWILAINISTVISFFIFNHISLREVRKICSMVDFVSFREIVSRLDVMGPLHSSKILQL